MAVGLDGMLIIHFQERTDKMRLIYADYSPQTNSIDVTTFENYILGLLCSPIFIWCHSGMQLKHPVKGSLGFKSG